MLRITDLQPSEISGLQNYEFSGYNSVLLLETYYHDTQRKMMCFSLQHCNRQVVLKKYYTRPEQWMANFGKSSENNQLFTVVMVRRMPDLSQTFIHIRG